MEWLIQIAAVVLALMLAAVKSLEYAPTEFSDAELDRLATSGDTQAAAEQRRRALLPTLVSFQYIKEIIISVLIAVLLFNAHGPTLASLLIVVYFFVAYLIAVRGWLAPLVRRVQRAIEPTLLSWASALQPFLKFFTPRQAVKFGARLASRGELQALIKTDDRILTDAEKARLLGALEFDQHTVADAMIKRDQIVTVGVAETVGPLLLDRLHKTKHNVFVAIKKDLDHIQGLLYMHDLVPLDPDLKTVKDAVRPTVYYMPAKEPLMAVLAASLQSGRQLFIVVDNNGNTLGLITLTDAISRLLGSAPPDHNLVTTDPKKAITHENSDKTA